MAYLEREVVGNIRLEDVNVVRRPKFCFDFCNSSSLVTDEADNDVLWFAGELSHKLELVQVSQKPARGRRRSDRFLTPRPRLTPVMR